MSSLMVMSVESTEVRSILASSHFFRNLPLSRVVISSKSSLPLISSLYASITSFMMMASKSLPPKNSSPPSATSVNCKPLMCITVTSKVPPPRS